jgi:hypothetical protein
VAVYERSLFASRASGFKSSNDRRCSLHVVRIWGQCTIDRGRMVWANQGLAAVAKPTGCDSFEDSAVYVAERVRSVDGFDTSSPAVEQKALSCVSELIASWMTLGAQVVG